MGGSETLIDTRDAIGGSVVIEFDLVLWGFALLQLS